MTGGILKDVIMFCLDFFPPNVTNEWLTLLALCQNNGKWWKVHSVKGEKGNKLPLLQIHTLVLWEPSSPKNKLWALSHPHSSSFMKRRRLSCGGRGQIIIMWVRCFCSKILSCLLCSEAPYLYLQAFICTNGVVKHTSAVCAGHPQFVCGQKCSLCRWKCVFSSTCSFVSPLLPPLRVTSTSAFFP